MGRRKFLSQVGGSNLVCANQAMRQVLTCKRDQVKFINCAACKIKRLEAIYVITIRRLGHYVRQDSAKTC
jgi:hypothetical protein